MDTQPESSAPATPATPNPLLYFTMWQLVPAKEKALLLAGWGYDVVYDYSFNKGEIGATAGRLLALKPAAIVLSLDEFPGYTRQLALGLKAKSGLRHIPRIAVGGEAEQRALLQKALPELACCSWDDLPGQLAQLLGRDKADAKVPPTPGAVRSFL